MSKKHRRENEDQTNDVCTNIEKKAKNKRNFSDASVFEIRYLTEQIFGYSKQNT